MNNWKIKPTITWLDNKVKPWLNYIVFASFLVAGALLIMTSRPIEGAIILLIASNYIALVKLDNIDRYLKGER